MACSRCGTPKGEGANYCYKCGYKFSNEPIDAISDDYKIDWGLSLIIGLLSGLLSGLFSAILTQLFIPDIIISGNILWISLIISGATILALLLCARKTIKETVEKKRRRAM